MNEGRCDERLKARVEESTCLTLSVTHTGFFLADSLFSAFFASHFFFLSEMNKVLVTSVVPSLSFSLSLSLSALSLSIYLPVSIYISLYSRARALSLSLSLSLALSLSLIFENVGSS